MSAAGTGNPAAVVVKAEEDRGPLPDHFPVGMKVLLVDDDLTCLSVIKRMLMKCKYDVTTCTRATRALSLLRENKSAFDLILSDVYMPDMDGFKLLELVGLEMDLPVIMMSADTRFTIVMKGIKHGACDFLIKPVRMAELQNIWQHVVRRKWLDNKETEHSGSMDEADSNRQVTDDAENATAAIDGTDGSGKSQKKKRDGKEDDDGEFDNTDPSSKKPRVVWSVELHQQFVNAVNQLGIEKAVPKRILELMNVPGLTRENVASHLQKFRLYLKRLSGVAQHHNALTNSLCGAPSNVKVGQLGKLDFQSLAVSGQIPAQTLAALQDELFGRPCNLDQSVLRQASMQGTNSPYNIERGISFSQSLPKGQGLSSYPAWTSNTLGAMGSTSSLGGLSTGQSSDMLMTMLQQQQQLNPVPSDSHNLLAVQPSCVVAPAQSSKSFQIQQDPIFSIQDSLEASSQSVSNFQAGNAIIPMNQNSVFLPSQSSASLQTGTNVVRNQGSMGVPSQPLASSSLVAKPGLLNQNPITVSSQPLRNFQAGRNSLPINQNSIIMRSQSPSTFQAEHNLVPVVHNRNLNSGSSIVDYSQLPSQLSVIPSTMGQVLEGNFSSVAVVNSYSNPVSVSSSLSSYSRGSGQQVQSSRGTNGFSNGATYLLDNSCNIQATTRVSGKLPNQSDGRSLGFVGKGTCLPSRFAMDDIDSPTNDTINSNMCIRDDGFLLNQDNLGLNATFQSGPCASTSMK